MNETVFLSIALTGLMVSFAHAALPSHWLPFVLAGRGQNWSKSRTLGVTALASLGHAFFTTILGILIVFLGIQAKDWMGSVFHFISSGILIAFGAFYLWRQKRGMSGHCHAHGHHHHEHGHSHDHAPAEQRPGVSIKSDKAVIASLLTMLTFSPCEGFLPVYLSGIQYGWMGFAVLSFVLAATTMAGMLFFTWVTMAGLEHVHSHVLEKYEAGILGGLLIILGLLVLVF